MKRQQVWLHMEDPGYEKKLYSFLNHHYGNVMDIHRYEECLGGIVPNRECLFLTDGDEESSFGHRIPLTLGESDEGIDLYQSGHSIAQQILERGGEDVGASSSSFLPSVVSYDKKDIGKMISVYSPIGGCGKTSFAITLTGCLAKREKGRILYLNLEGASDWSRYFVTSSSYNFSDVLYSVVMDVSEERMSEQLEKAVQQQGGGVYFIRPCTSFEDLTVLTPQELSRTIGALKGAFDWIVCDMNTAFQGVNRVFLGESEHCFLIGQNHPGARIKVRDFIEGIAVCEERADGWREKFVMIERGKKRERESTLGYWLPEEKDIFYIKDHVLYPDENTEYFRCVTEIVRGEIESGKHMAGTVPYV